MAAEEWVDIVDEADAVVGTLPVGEARKQKQTYRLVAVFLFNEKGELFVQQRGSNGRFPCHGDSSAGGHVKSGETYEAAARREMKEELGIANVTLNLVLKEKVAYEGFSRFVTLFVGKVSEKDVAQARKTVVGQFSQLPRIQQSIERGEKFTPVFLALIHRVIYGKIHLF